MKNFITKHKNWLLGLLTAVFWLAVWQILALLIQQKLFLPSPYEVFLAMGRLLTRREFYAALFNTFWHITAGFLLAFVIGILLAALAGRFAAAARLLKPLIATVNATPVASFAILALILAGSRHIALLLSFLMVMPIIYANTLAGIVGVPRERFEAAEVFGMPRGERLRYIYLPEALPHVLAACHSGVGISWKAGVAAEVIGITVGSIGGWLYESKLYLKIDELFAYTVVVILVSYCFEKLFLWLLKRGAAALSD